MTYNNVFEITNYKEACKFLQNKYDREGIVRENYFNFKGDGKVTKNSHVGHGTIGLQYHHIKEDTVPDLCSPDVAKNNDPAYQRAENMCYCNLLEHAWLHILITENNFINDTDDDFITGVNGVQWMMININSIMCNHKVNEDNITEDKGTNYNYNNIITNNIEMYHKVINRFCTSAFIRQRLDKTPDELADMICYAHKKDAIEGKLTIWDEVHKEAKNTFLFDWNVNAFCDLENYLTNNNSALIQICTSGGKTTTALEYCRIHNVKAIVLGPSNTIKDAWNDPRNKDYIIEPINYQTFMNDYKNYNYDNCILICDEAHHIQAERWGEGVRWVLANTNCKVIGLTATPTNKQLNGEDIEFAGRICYGLNLADGIANGDIHPFSYVQSIYKMEDVKNEFDKFGTTGTLLWNKLNIRANENHIHAIMQKHMPGGFRKIITFCSHMGDTNFAVKIMHDYDPNMEVRIVTSEQSREYNQSAKEWFNNTNDRNVCIVTVNMVNEGAHYEGVNTLVMFRRTRSYTLYTQQLGRVIVSKAKPNNNGIVFDFTNNAQHLIYEYANEDEKEHESVKRSKDEIDRTTRALKEIAERCKEIIYEDYTENCVEVLNALNDLRGNSIVLGKKVVNKLVDELEFPTEDLTSILGDSWGSFGCKVQATEKNAKHTCNKEVMNTLNGANTKTSSTIATNDSIPKGAKSSRRNKTEEENRVNFFEKLQEAFKMVIRNLYVFGEIELSADDSGDWNCKINNMNFMKEICEELDINHVEEFAKLIEAMKYNVYTIASDLSR